MEQQTAPVKKQRILSGIQPSGTPTLGNYIGAMRNWKLLEDQYDCLYMIADLHAITVRQEPAKLRAQSIQLLALLLAIGLDPEKNVLFFQSHVHQHAEMNWLLDCFTYMGEMSRMTQFKDKSAKHADNINCGLFTYPVLMAGDILLYQANLVPVGVDQTQHLEICRDIATRFNGLYGNVFTIPEGYYPKLGARVMSLQDPKRKMSKSDPDDCFISMLDGPDVVRRKLRRAVTDSESEIRFDAENKPGVSNLLAMLCALTGESMDHAVESFAGKGYGDLKSAVADAIVATLEPIQADYNRYMSDKAYLETVYRQGAERAGRMAERTLSKAMKKIGFIGVGIMGKSMVKNLMKAGFELHIYARTKSKVNDVIEEGAIFHETIGECVRASEAVITMVGFPQDVEEVYFDEGNIMDQAEKGMYLIDMTTTSPMISKKIYEEGKKKGVHVVDAPVTGGDTGAKAGTLSILVGGNKEDYEACMPLFEAMGTNINYQGEAGCGQHAKMVNQIMIAGTMSGLCEALSYAKAKDLDCETVLKSVATGAAGSKQLDFFGEKILHGDYTPGFFMKHFIKDMKIALIEANQCELDLDVLSQTLANYEVLEAEGYGDLGTQALIL